MNPKTVLKAYTTGSAEIEIAGIKLQPVIAGHILALEAVANPLATGGTPKMADVFTAAALLSVSSREARALAANPAELEKSAGDLADATPPSAIAPLAETISRRIAEAFSTSLAPKTQGEYLAGAESTV